MVNAMITKSSMLFYQVYLYLEINCIRKYFQNVLHPIFGCIRKAEGSKPPLRACPEPVEGERGVGG